MQFGCAAGDAGYLLGDLADAGADPGQWGNRHPGRVHVVAPGIPDDRALIPARIDNAPPVLVGQLVRPQHVHTDLDAMSATAAGEAYVNRRRYDTPPSTAGAKGWTPMTPTSPATAAATEPADDDTLDITMFGEADEDPQISPSVDDDVPPLGSFSLAPPPPPAKASPAEVRAAVLGVIRAWGPGTEFRPVDIARALPQHAARHRSTVSRLLAALLDSGELDEVAGGVYRMPAAHAASSTRG